MTRFHHDESLITTQTIFFFNRAPQQWPRVRRALDRRNGVVDKDWSTLEEYTLIPGLPVRMNFFFGFNDAQLVRKLVQTVSRYQTSSLGLKDVM